MFLAARGAGAYVCLEDSSARGGGLKGPAIGWLCVSDPTNERPCQAYPCSRRERTKSEEGLDVAAHLFEVEPLLPEHARAVVRGDCDVGQRGRHGPLLFGRLEPDSPVGGEYLRAGEQGRGRQRSGVVCGMVSKVQGHEGRREESKGARREQLRATGQAFSAATMSTPPP